MADTESAAPKYAVYSAEAMAGITAEKMAIFHKRQAEAAPHESLIAILKKYDLVWTHRAFEMDDGPQQKMFLALKNKETGELEDMPDDDAMGPGKKTFLLPYTQAALVSVRPENWWGLEEPNESIVLLKDEDEGYNPAISGEFTRVATYLRKVWNEDRARYAVKHRKVLKFYPTYEDSSDKELYDAIMDAMSKGQEANLAHAKHPEKLSSRIYQPDWSKRKAKEPSREMNRADRRLIAMYRKHYEDNPEAPRREQNMEAIEKLEDDLEANLKDKDNKFMTMHFVRHKDRRGEEITRPQLITSALAKHAVIAPQITIGAIRVSVYKPKGKEDKPKRGKDKKAQFKNVTLPIELTTVHWLANGVPWGKSTEVDVQYDMDGILPDDVYTAPERKMDMGGVLPESGNRKRKDQSDDSDDDDDAALAAAADATESREAKRAKGDDVQLGDPEE